MDHLTSFLLQLHQKEEKMNKYGIIALVAIFIGMAGFIGYDAGIRKGFTKGSIDYLEGYRIDLPEEISQVSNKSIDNIQVTRDNAAKTLTFFFLDNKKNIREVIQKIFVCEEGISVQTDKHAYDYLTTNQFDSIFGFKLFCPKLLHPEIFKGIQKKK